MIAQSVLGLRSGGLRRMCGVVTHIFIFLVVLLISPVINIIPLAALVGVMFMVVIHTFEWSSVGAIYACLFSAQTRNSSTGLKLIPAMKIKRSDALIIAVVSILAVFTNLAYGVAAGVVLAAFAYSWDSEKALNFLCEVKADGTKVYIIEGPLYFGSVDKFEKFFDLKNDPEEVEVRLHRTALSDFSAIHSLNKVGQAATSMAAACSRTSCHQSGTSILSSSCFF